MNTRIRSGTRNCTQWWRYAGAVFLALSSVQGQSPSYSVIGLPESLQALAVNASGQVAGFRQFQRQTVHAALYSGGQLTDLGTLGGDFSEAVAINASGQTVGDSGLSNGLTHATLWSNGQIIDLGTCRAGRPVMPPGSTTRARSLVGATRCSRAQTIRVRITPSSIRMVK